MTTRTIPPCACWWTCERCNAEVEHTEWLREAGRQYPAYPDGWRGVMGTLLCAGCIDIVQKVIAGEVAS